MAKLGLSLEHTLDNLEPFHIVPYWGLTMVPAFKYGQLGPRTIKSTTKFDWSAGKGRLESRSDS